jgi:phenylacetate-coenzyme A ligase PaaK-like adenylate-forming protein
MDSQALKQSIFTIETQHDFNALAIEIFHYQYEQNKVYRQFVDALGVQLSEIVLTDDIPFLPVGFFKTHQVVSGDQEAQVVFESSGTTGPAASRHFVTDFNLYEQSFGQGLHLFYGDIRQYCIFALLPSYIERQNSSLVHMVERLMWKSNRAFGGFFLNEMDKLAEIMLAATSEGNKVMLFGVTFALLEMAQKHPIMLPGAIIIETGGMKGRRKEITREELHQVLKKGFGVATIHSEYGMTELLSQAWSQGEGIFQCPPWMKVLISDPNDPLSTLGNGQTGGINVIDLANLNSCSFIATQDLGRKFDDNSFEVLGRFDASDVRGCSMLF